MKAKMQLSLSESSFDWIFEPRTRLHHCALEVADAVFIPEERCFLLPVRNSSSSPTRLRRGQLLGWIQPADVLARQNVRKAQKRQKHQYDRHAVPPKYHVGDRVFLYQPSAIQGKTRKFARPLHGPYRILELTPTNASIRPVDKPEEAPIFVSLDRIRKCAEEIPNQSWLGRTKRKRKPRAKKKQPKATGRGPEQATLPEVAKSGDWASRLRPRTSVLRPREM